MLDDWSHTLLQTDPMRIYRAKRDAAHRTVTSKYNILGFISSGTYGRVYKAQSVESESAMYAIKKFKPDKEGDVVTYTGISQSAIREIAVSSTVLCSQLERLRIRHAVNSSTERYLTKMLSPSRKSFWRTSLSIWSSITQSMTFWYVPYIGHDVKLEQCSTLFTASHPPLLSNPPYPDTISSSQILGLSASKRPCLPTFHAYSPQGPQAR